MINRPDDLSVENNILSDKRKHNTDANSDSLYGTIGCSFITFPMGLCILSLSPDPLIHLSGIIGYFVAHLIAFRFRDHQDEMHIAGTKVYMIAAVVGGLLMHLIKLGLERLGWLIDLLV